MTVLLAVDPHAPQAERIAQAAAVLRGGGLVAFPTETVYGLGAHALDAAAVRLVFAAKGRPPHNPLIVHVADAAEVGKVAADWPASAARLAECFWPGPLTLVLPKNPRVPDEVTAGGPTVAVRLPAHPVARALLEATGVPVAAPSANRSSRLSPTRAEHVLRDLEGRIDLVLDGGSCPGGIESTVLDLTTSPPRLLRPGLVSLAELEAVIGPVGQTFLSALSVGTQECLPHAAAALPSPGLLARHYAPRTPLECAADGGAEHVAELCREGQRVGWLTMGLPREAPPGVVVRTLPGDPAGYAAGLYAALHELDMAGLDRIVAALPPDGVEWQAIRDRLRRASQ
jgi:L-threonylcarbamoyladenylate synthase